MTLHSLHIKNFQSVKDLEVDFGTFTVLVGKSNSGKSAVLRAIHTLVRNSFTPAYVRMGEGSAEVAATFDATTVRTIRGKESTYVLGTEVFTKCSRTVPDAVAGFFRMPLVAEEDLSFTNQFDLPFLVGGKAARASAVVGTITNAVLVNALAQETNRVRLNIRQRIQLREADLEGLETQLQEFYFLSAMEETLETVREWNAQLRRLHTVSAELARLLGEVVRVEASKVPEPPLPTVSREEMTALMTLARAVDVLREWLRQADIQSMVPVPLLPALDEEFSTLKKLLNRSQVLREYITQVRQARDRLLQGRTKLAGTVAALEPVQQEMAQRPVCPTCGQLT